MTAILDATHILLTENRVYAAVMSKPCQLIAEHFSHPSTGTVPVEKASGTQHLLDSTSSAELKLAGLVHVL
jgi:hypothetical protein